MKDGARKAALLATVSAFTWSVQVSAQTIFVNERSPRLDLKALAAVAEKARIAPVEVPDQRSGPDLALPQPPLLPDAKRFLERDYRPAPLAVSVPSPLGALSFPPNRLPVIPLVTAGGPGDTPDSILDKVDINGIGQMVRYFPDGSGGACTVSLINPRTVIFAAHCINENEAQTDYVDPSVYGISHGGMPVSFGFGANNRPGVRAWAGVTDPSKRWQTNVDLSIYNSNWVTYDPRVRLYANGADPDTGEPIKVPSNAIAGDVALAALDTPAVGVPTWTLLFSPLKGPTHIVTTGYGLHGTGADGMDSEAGIDYRRRSAENMVAAYYSALVGTSGSPLFPGLDPSIDDGIETYKQAGYALSNVYWVSFSDPNYGTDKAATLLDAVNLDDNGFNETSYLPHEGSGAPGDSGGPMIVDRLFEKPVIAGVLSAGYPKSIGTLVGALFGLKQFSYGWGYFYQPLTLYWDFIVANNPYKYVNARAGDGKWTDPNHWVLGLDPNYAIEGPDGKLLNALPANAATGLDATNDYWGQACPLGQSFCIDTVKLRDNVAAGQDLDTALSNAFVDKATSYTLSTGGASGTQRTAEDLTQAVTVQIAKDATVRAAIATLFGLPEDDIAALAGAIREATSTDLGRLRRIVLDKAGVWDGALRMRLDELDPQQRQVTRLDIARSMLADASPGDLAALRALIAASTAPPPPTFGNGLPGATGFVPINSDGDAGNGVAPRYFDITLSAAGRTTLDVSAQIDRLRISGSRSILDIAQSGSLKTLIDTTLTGGNLNVDGTYTSVGDLSVLSGILSGKGVISAPYVTSVMGVVSPGQSGEVATLTIRGNYIQASGGILAIDIGPNGTSDNLIVAGNPEAKALGTANLGGLLGLTAVTGYLPRYGDSFTVVTAEGGVTGKFDDVSNLPGLLRPVVNYRANDIVLSIDAASYLTEIDAKSPIQSSFARLLDADRGAYASLRGVYGDLDVADSGTVRTALERMGPYALQARRALARVQTEGLAQLRRDRIAVARSGQDAGTLAIIGQPLQYAALAANPASVSPSALDQAAAGRVTAPGVRLPDDMSAYVAAGYFNGRASGLARTTPDGRSTKFDGWYVSAGIEGRISDEAVVGGSLSYSDANATPVLGKASGQLIQGAVYGESLLPGGFSISGQAAVAAYVAKSRRAGALPAQGALLTSEKSNLAYEMELNVGRPIGAGGIKATPFVGVRAANVDFAKARENGGDAALLVEADRYGTAQGRAGLTLGGEGTRGALRFVPGLSAAYVHDFKRGGEGLYAGFANGPARTTFTGPDRDRDWAEVGGSLALRSRDLTFEVSTNGVLGRDDLRYQTYRASVRFGF